MMPMIFIQMIVRIKPVTEICTNKKMARRNGNKKSLQNYKGTRLWTEALNKFVWRVSE